MVYNLMLTEFLGSECVRTICINYEVIKKVEWDESLMACAELERICEETFMAYIAVFFWIG